jgi:hypothetical protein
MIPKEQQPITLPLLQQKVKRVSNDLQTLHKDVNDFTLYINQLCQQSKTLLSELEQKNK